MANFISMLADITSLCAPSMQRRQWRYYLIDR
jgi:hypothetical protein